MNKRDLGPVLARIADALERFSPAAPDGVGIDAAEAFVWQADRRSLDPVPVVNRVDIALLKGIDFQRVGTTACVDICLALCVA